MADTTKTVTWERLPTNVDPVHYDLLLKPDLRTEAEGGTFEFSGQVKIQVRVKEAGVRELKLNAAELSFRSAEVVQGGVRREGAVVADEASEVVTISFEDALEEGSATLEIVYTGTLNDKMKGFYRSTYKSAKDGKEKIMATTQFEATDARRALPCWDEPARKATFSVRLHAPKDLHAISNMPEVDTVEIDDNTVEHVYDKSPIMSSYLLAFVIGEFDMIETKTQHGVLVRVFTPVGKSAQGEFALDVASRCLDLYDDYFEVPYPLPKLDLLAIPDFSAGAMENWGCVTYRETALLYDPAKSSISTKRWVAIVVAHELAHQWFGNLVTMEWWSELYLNEAQASYYEVWAVDKLFPEWNQWTDFVSSHLKRALDLDSLESSHPIEVEVHHPDEIDEVFDRISYDKGCSVVRMLVEYLGEEPFRQGMVEYMRRFPYKNAVSRDLWSTLEEVCNKPVVDLMSTWTLKMGFPLITVDSFDAESASLQISQQRFLKSGKLDADSPIWPVPLSIKSADTEGGVVHLDQLVETRTADIGLGRPHEVGWIKLNADQVGLYRVNYTPELWGKLRAAILAGDENLSASDRLGLQDDAFSLTRAGFLSADTLLSVVSAYRAERNEVVWSALAANLDDLDSLLKHQPYYPKFAAFCVDLLADVAEYVGWDKREDEPDHIGLLRTIVLSRLGGYQHAPTIEEAVKRFELLCDVLIDGKDVGKAPEAIVSPGMRVSVFRMALGQLGRAGYEKVMRLYESTDLNEEKVRCLAALGACKDEDSVQRTLEFGLNGCRKQDAMYVFASLAHTRHGAEPTWAFMQSRWSEFLDKFGSSWQLSRMVQGLGGFSSFAKADEIETFFETHRAPAAERAVQQALETIRSNAAWLERDGSAIETFLSA